MLRQRLGTQCLNLGSLFLSTAPVLRGFFLGDRDEYYHCYAGGFVIVVLLGSLKHGVTMWESPHPPSGGGHEEVREISTYRNVSRRERSEIHVCSLQNFPDCSFSLN